MESTFNLSLRFLDDKFSNWNDLVLYANREIISNEWNSEEQKKLILLFKDVMFKKMYNGHNEFTLKKIHNWFKSHLILSHLDNDVDCARSLNSMEEILNHERLMNSYCLFDILNVIDLIRKTSTEKKIRKISNKKKVESLGREITDNMFPDKSELIEMIRSFGLFGKNLQKIQNSDFKDFIRKKSYRYPGCFKWKPFEVFNDNFTRSELLDLIYDVFNPFYVNFVIFKTRTK